MAYNIKGGKVQKNKDRELAAYNDMLSKCYDPDHPEYPSNGGRGITVCDRWRLGENGKSGFDCFYEDMGPMPSTGTKKERPK